jgi:hypothetical protein
MEGENQCRSLPAPSEAGSADLCQSSPASLRHTLLPIIELAFTDFSAVEMVT